MNGVRMDVKLQLGRYIAYGTSQRYRVVVGQSLAPSRPEGDPCNVAHTVVEACANVGRVNPTGRRNGLTSLQRAPPLSVIHSRPTRSFARRRVYGAASSPPLSTLSLPFRSVQCRYIRRTLGRSWWVDLVMT